MDNCGGGQRLPPDGDEFPASYQEFKTPATLLGPFPAPKPPEAMLSKKKLEISDYYSKETEPKEPPPLPLSRPPKLDPPKKSLANGDSRHIDKKSNPTIATIFTCVQFLQKSNHSLCSF